MEVQEEPASTEDLIEKTEVDEEVIEDRLDRLKEIGKVRREDGYWVAQEK
jgi:predicted Rossmann fold nucleotide-binding protein DprA/Smf involved in DNA uptake